MSETDSELATTSQGGLTCEFGYPDPVGYAGTVKNRSRVPMREPPCAQRLIRIDGLADQGVEEVERPYRREDLRRREPVGRQLRGRWLQSRQLSGHRHFGLRSEHREGLRQ